MLPLLLTLVVAAAVTAAAARRQLHICCYSVQHTAPAYTCSSAFMGSDYQAHMHSFLPSSL
jgi:hypothetical protein